MKIVIPDHIPFTPEATTKLQQLGATVYDDLPADDAAVIDRIRDAEIVTVNWIDFGRACIDAAPHLRYIISSAVGYNSIDHAYAASKGIKVLNCPTQNAEAVAEHAICLMLAVARQLVRVNNNLRAGNWQGADMQGMELGGKRLGLVGYGRVGQLIERKLRGFDMSVQHVNSASSGQELDDLLASSDIVCLCVGLNDQTRHLLDQRRLGLLQSHTILINVARGAVVDQAALLQALKSGAIRGAGLDVYENEPTSGSVHTDILELANLPNVVATPHIAYNTSETIDRLGVELIQNIESCVDGKPINVVND